MNTQTAAKWFGWVTLVAGILGFIPGIVSEGYLLGIFQVNVIINVLHILTGLIALFSVSTLSASKTFFKTFGVIYLVLALLGLAYGHILGLFSINTADIVLYVIFAAYSLYYGFRKEGMMMA
ncbi:MAG: DUF4383 domain-containing protein [Patescibacteria group bacterium]